jgi:hypothetical protein
MIQKAFYGVEILALGYMRGHGYNEYGYETTHEYL